jgi:ketosteroid isomerase-like protein
MADELIARLRKLEFVNAARDAINTYCLAVDVSDIDMLRTAFTEDAQLHGQYMGDRSGRDAILDYFKGALEAPMAHRKHYATNFLTTGTDGDTVSATCYFFSYHGETDDLHVAWGRYEYQVLLKADGSAAICDMTIILEQPVVGLDAFKRKG